MPDSFSTLGILVKNGDARTLGALQEVARIGRELGCQIFLEEENGVLLPDYPGPRLDFEEMGQRCDLAVVIGGDGSLLRAARILARQTVPLVGVNLGRLGFLADIPLDRLEHCLGTIVAGAYQREERFLLQYQTVAGDTDNPAHLALNDIVLHKWHSPRLIEFEVYIDDMFVNRQRADGLIVSTPTGSTAYALSAGGPLLLPTLDALLIVSICPHALSNRPIVVSADSQIKIRLFTDTDHVRLTCDGQQTHELAAGNDIIISQARHRVSLLHPPKHQPYHILREKLGWSENRPRPVH